MLKADDGHVTRKYEQRKLEIETTGSD